MRAVRGASAGVVGTGAETACPPRPEPTLSIASQITHLVEYSVNGTIQVDLSLARRSTSWKRRCRSMARPAIMAGLAVE